MQFLLAKHNDKKRKKKGDYKHTFLGIGALDLLFE